MKRPCHIVLLGIQFCAMLAFAQREPVLKQIDVPHDYYYREMYLPQLTTGPSCATWSPDGEELIYSMAGSLWRQKINEKVTIQITQGPGYDYQPDWSPDGQHVIFTRYTGDALELQLLNLATNEISPLTAGGDVNLDARFSPDGKRIAYVSTKNTGHFRIWIGDLKVDQLESNPFSPERETKILRYYYSQWDHQLSPSWSPDGRNLVFVSNPDNIYGTGAIYTAPLTRPDRLTLIQKEETTWKARPDWSHDGKRVVYSSYLGRQWNQLWVTTAAGGGDPYALTFGKFDATYPRWSPDNNRIAYISNEGGNTALWIFEVLGGKSYQLEIEERKFIHPVSQLTINVQDKNQKALPSRISILAGDGRSYAPEGAWMHGDDAFDRSKQKFETYYFHSEGQSIVTLPKGIAYVRVWRGLENKIHHQQINITDDQASLTVTIEPLSFPVNMSDWVSADVHVHMNYGGHYRNAPEAMVNQAKAEDLDIVFNTVVNKEQRIPDIDYFSTQPDPSSDSEVLLLHSQEHHTSYWGHMGLLGLNDHYLIPGYSGYPNTAIQSVHPSNSVIADLAHQQNALVGYVHPFYEAPDPAKVTISNALPIDVALGHIDYYETVGFSYHKPSAEVWHRLLNCGFKISAAGGTDAMANYASLRGPVGVDRTYISLGSIPDNPAQRRDAWLKGLKEGRSLATNSAILELKVNGKVLGSEIRLTGKKAKINFEGFMRSVIPMDHLEIIVNGKVAKSIALNGEKTAADFSGKLEISQSSWVLLRAWNDSASPEIQDFYPYATTSAIYVLMNNQPIRSKVDAEYFLQWIDRVRESATLQTYLTESEKELTLNNINEARKIFENRK